MQERNPDNESAPEEKVLATKPVGKKRKPYEKPAIIETVKAEARAVACAGAPGTAKATSMDCPQGPISS